ncbi:GspH/FimT family pseudopilin [Dyella sp. ASV21]|uniref:GspH/FimT family pseudopilin n=1 Tax=Dyella sp. ASV21 TaxID=2795114 RepID=UPI0018EA77C1|nr:GspH/FimT family pseudopilin [Dyella sp. ASV21]
MMPACAPRSRDHGFTLIELMVTLAVVVIITVVAIPNLRTFVQNVRRDSVVDGLVASLHYTRNQALSTDQTTLICAGTTGVGCTGGTWGGGWEVLALPANASTVSLTSHAIVTTSATPTLKALNGSTSLTFNGQGLVTNMPSAGSETIVVCDSRGSNYARAVFINTVGYIQASPNPGTAPNGTALTCP